MRHVVNAIAVLALSASLAIASPTETTPSESAPTERSPNVVGGAPAAAGRWNDAAAVLFGGTAGCTGTLIAPNVVLTAGHCIGGIDAVKLGVTDYDAPGGETIEVIQEIEHPSSQSSYDLGLLVLARDSKYAPRVLATGCAIDEFLSNSAPVAIVGYGAHDEYGNEYDSILREAQTTVTDYDCTGGRGCNSSVSPNGELGAGGDGIDACYGDSGGPLYLLTRSGDYLVGVTSRGYWDVELPCAEGGIYVRPDAVVDWIEAVTDVEIPRATCGYPPTVTGGDPTDLTVEAGETVSADIEVSDPEATETHSLTSASGGMHGEITGDGLTVSYHADSDYEGPDAFTVEVSDTGVPPLSTTVDFTVTVVPNEGCGCRATGGQGAGAALLLMGLALLPLRRRRR